MKREDRKKRITRQRREQILEAALLVFSRRGYDRATIPDVAREAGVAVGTIYNYYPGKRDLLVAITNEYIIEPFSNIVKKSCAEGDVTMITRLMENRLDFGLEGVNKFLPMLGEVQRDPELRHSYTEKVIRPVMDMMEEYVTSRIQSGAFRDVNPKVVTRAIGGMVVGFMLLYRIEGEESPVHNLDRNQLAAEMAGLVLRGLQKS